MFKIKKSRSFDELKEIAFQYIGSTTEYIFEIGNFTEREIKIYKNGIKSELKKRSKCKNIKVKKISKYEMLSNLYNELQKLNRKLDSVMCQDYNGKERIRTI